MKKRLLFLTLSLLSLIANTSYSQVKLGVLGGLNYADFDAETEFKP